MKYITQGGESPERYELLISLTRISSEDIKAALKDYLVTGLADATAAAVNGVPLSNFTRGEHKGRQVHVVAMESRLGRKLKSDECVHHIDGDKLNNEESNLALVTLSGHARLHRHEDKLAGKVRGRNENGTWC